MNAYSEKELGFQQFTQLTRMHTNIYIYIYIYINFYFFNYNIINYRELFTVSIFGRIRNYLLTVIVSHCSSVTMQSLFMQRFSHYICNHYSCRESEIIIDRMIVTVQHCSLLYRTLYFLYGPWLSACIEFMTCLLDGLISHCLLTEHQDHSLDGPGPNSQPLPNCLHVTKIKG